MIAPEAPGGPVADPPAAPPWFRDPDLWLGATIAVVLSVVQTLVRGDALWGQSDGVYALTSRLLLHGDDLYGRLVGAQPPITLYAGVPALAISDTLTSIHLWMGLLQVAGGVGAAIAVRRLTGSRAATAAAPIVAVCLPWAVNQHGVFLPELVGLPFLLGGAAAAARGRTAPLAGVLLALAIFVKLPFVLPAVLVALVAADRGRTLRWLAGAAVAQALAFTAIFGTGMWEQTVLAQGQSDLHAWSALPGTVIQSGWTLVGVLVAAALLLLRPVDWPADRAQLRASVALAVGSAGTWVSSLKVGTSLYVLVPFEAALVPLALAGVVATWRGPRADAGRGAATAGVAAAAEEAAPTGGAGPSDGIAVADGGPSVDGAAPAGEASTAGGTGLLGTGRGLLARRAALVLVAVLTVAQSVAVLAPPHDRFPWTRPGTSPAYGQLLSEDEVHTIVSALRTCPAGAPSSRLAYFAFLADRRMPDDQPDDFLPTKSDRLADVLTRMRADAPVCPPR